MDGAASLPDDGSKDSVNLATIKFSINGTEEDRVLVEYSHKPDHQVLTLPTSSQDELPAKRHFLGTRCMVHFTVALVSLSMFHSCLSGTPLPPLSAVCSAFIACPCLLSIYCPFACFISQHTLFFYNTHTRTQYLASGLAINESSNVFFWLVKSS